MLALVEAVPADGGGHARGQGMQALTDGLGVVAAVDQVGHGRQVGVEERARVLALLGDETLRPDLTGLPDLITLAYLGQVEGRALRPRWVYRH
ncbi:hypothetical protein ABT072_38845 [Streptomyces sp. NPDC002589]|uniref:hypothetical protein n=1 Tax=Streptomyces sp. NPDC002589 TaxID=3154420 RepID=UPI0033165948